MPHSCRLLLLFWCALQVAQQSEGKDADRCLPCHPREVARFESSAMGQSIAAEPHEPPGSFVHELSGSRFKISYKDGVMHQRLEEKGLSAEYPIAYSIGYGKVGKSYLIDLAGHLFQSPAAYYTEQRDWGVSPGYEQLKVVDFSRSINAGCLSCHTGAAQSSDSKAPLQPITCVRCHGPSERHLARPVGGSIVNPAKLAVRQRDSVCEQCHLEGATLVLNPGKSLWDFHPGQMLEENQTDYVSQTRAGDPSSVRAVSHAEQLAASVCRRASGEKLWCGTCHDPHGDPVDRKTQIREICQSCHTAVQLAKAHRGDRDDCVSCHMPRLSASDISHAAVTDHRIARYPSTVAAPSHEQVLTAWQPALPEFVTRNLGLALFNTAKLTMSGPGFQRSFEILSQMKAERDAPVLAAKGYMLLGTQHADAAIPLFEQATRVAPKDGEYWLDLAVAQDAAGKNTEAVGSFRKSIEADPYDFRPYRGLADLYGRLHDATQSKAIVNQFLTRIPQSVMMRLPE